MQNCHLRRLPPGSSLRRSLLLCAEFTPTIFALRSLNCSAYIPFDKTSPSTLYTRGLAHCQRFWMLRLICPRRVATKNNKADLLPFPKLISLGAVLRLCLPRTPPVDLRILRTFSDIFYLKHWQRVLLKPLTVTRGSRHLYNDAMHRA